MFYKKNKNLLSIKKKSFLSLNAKINKFLIKKNLHFFKNKIKYFFKKQKKLRIRYFRKFFFYFPLKAKIDSGFLLSLTFHTYQSNNSWLVNKFSNKKYHKFVQILKKRNYLLRKKQLKKYLKFKKILFFNFFSFLYIYNSFFYNTNIEIFYFFKKFKINRKKIIFQLIFSFKQQKLFINLQNFKKKNYTFMSPGFFIKFFEKKKSIKKKKSTKILIAKYLRKIYLLSKIKYTIFFFRNNPSNLIEILTTFNSPIVHQFINPIDNELINEKNKKLLNPITKILYFIFLKTTDYGFNKKKKIGRIKRKISRKLIIQNKLID